MKLSLWQMILANLGMALLTVGIAFVVVNHYNNWLLKKWYPDQHRKPEASPPTDLPRR